MKKEIIMKLKNLLFTLFSCIVLQSTISYAVTHEIFINAGLTNEKQKADAIAVSIPAGGIGIGGVGKNNEIAISPWLGNWRPLGLRGAKFNQDKFNTDGTYRELEYYEINPDTGDKIRQCHVFLDHAVTYNSHIYIHKNCSVYVQEITPVGYVRRDIQCTGLTRYVNIPYVKINGVVQPLPRAQWETTKGVPEVDWVLEKSAQFCKSAKDLGR